MPARPFLKWVGGKHQILPTLLEVFPRTISTYFEPFLGGGAVFFALSSETRFQRAILNDWNKEVIDCYCVVRDFPTELAGSLSDLEKSYLSYPKAIFDNWKASSPADLDPVTRASRTILLNKTGFNGLFRTNASGIFNVPWGKRIKARLFDEDNLLACANALNSFVRLQSGDFTLAVETAKSGDFVYFDPPYVPVSKSSNFTSYTEGRFTIDDQYRLAACFKELVSQGVQVALSNSNASEVRSLYAGFPVLEIKARRCINSKGDRRGPVKEVLVLGNISLPISDTTGASPSVPPDGNSSTEACTDEAPEE
jgi:DNA adenine methylase